MPFPHNLTQIDDLTRPDHWYLSEEDDCYFLGEYTAGRGFSYSETNQLIHNLKKSMEKRERLEWRHKETAILEAGEALRNAIPEKWRNQAVFVPIPPSKAKGDLLYDDRMVQILQAIGTNPPVKICEIITQITSTEAVHFTTVTRDPSTISELYTVQDTFRDLAPEKIVICDDVLTTGAHFKAIKSILAGLFPEAKICGVFIARRALTKASDDFNVI